MLLLVDGAHTQHESGILYWVYKFLSLVEDIRDTFHF